MVNLTCKSSSTSLTVTTAEKSGPLLGDVVSILHKGEDSHTHTYKNFVNHDHCKSGLQSILSDIS